MDLWSQHCWDGGVPHSEILSQNNRKLRERLSFALTVHSRWELWVPEVSASTGAMLVLPIQASSALQCQAVEGCRHSVRRLPKAARIYCWCSSCPKEYATCHWGQCQSAEPEIGSLSTFKWKQKTFVKLDRIKAMIYRPLETILL